MTPGAEKAEEADVMDDQLSESDDLIDQPEPRCKLCRSPWRVAANSLLAQQKSATEVHKYLIEKGEFNVSVDSIKRHRARGHSANLERRAVGEALRRFRRDQEDDIAAQIQDGVALGRHLITEMWERAAAGELRAQFKDLVNYLKFIETLESRGIVEQNSCDRKTVYEAVVRAVDIAASFISVDRYPDFKWDVKHDERLREIMGLPPLKGLRPIPIEERKSEPIGRQS